MTTRVVVDNNTDQAKCNHIQFVEVIPLKKSDNRFSFKLCPLNIYPIRTQLNKEHRGIAPFGII